MFMLSTQLNDVITSKSASWCQKVHDVKNTSWRQNIRHGVKFVMTLKHVMTSKTRHDFKRFVMMSKIHQQFEIKWKIRHDVKKFVIKSKICHDVKKFIMHDIKNMSWHQKVCYNIKNQKHVFIIFCSRNNKINMSGAQKDSHEVKKCVNSSKSLLWRQ